ncbi:MAG: oligoribonuclease, partial [Burkholderiaceae bacterium]
MNHDPTATPERERLLEVAMVVTGPQLWPVVHGPVVVVHQSDTLLSAMDAWNTGTHTRSGLVDKVRQSPLSEAQAESVLLDFMQQYVPERASPMCGTTIGQDRRFLNK